jgi:glycosyltransferase involved in cell wall biosynthesis
MESLACGVPVLVSEQVNLADDVRAADAGWVVPLDARALEDALAEALHRGDERQRRGAAGQALASRFTWPRVATELIELYRGVARSAC